MVIFNKLINICNFFTFILIMVNIRKQINKQINKIFKFSVILKNAEGF